MIQTLIVVAGGGAIGSALRYLVGVWAMRLFGPGFPFGTLAVNIIGCFVMGCLVMVLGEKTGTRYAPFLMTGILGGFTTFSAFSLDAVRLYEGGQVGLAALYVGASVGFGLMALVAGMALVKGIFA